LVRSTIEARVSLQSGTPLASETIINTKDQQIEKLTAEVAELRAELETQKALVSALLTRIYGAKSEKISHEQLLLAFLEDEAKKPEAADGNEEPPAANKAAKPKRAKRTNKLLHSLEGLPTIERTITDPQVLANPELFRLLSEEISIRLHASPGTFTREVIKRQIHVCKGDPDAVPFTTPLEPCLLPGSVLTPSLGALLLTEKFCYHQPFYRQEWRLRASHGIELTRNNMCNWHDHLADWLLPLYQIIAQRIRSSDYIQVDETPIDCLEPGKGKTATGYFWAYHHLEHGPLFDLYARHRAEGNLRYPFVINGFTVGGGGLEWGRFWGFQSVLPEGPASRWSVELLERAVCHASCIPWPSHNIRNQPPFSPMYSAQIRSSRTFL
jgi:transposase